MAIWSARRKLSQLHLICVRASAPCGLTSPASLPAHLLPLLRPITKAGHRMMRRSKSVRAKPVRKRAESRTAPALVPLARAEIDVTDLLGRPAVNLDTPELQRFLAGKTILVTGAGGSIGSEICRQIMRFCPASLVLVEQAENSLFEIDRELRATWLGATIHACVAD